MPKYGGFKKLYSGYLNTESLLNMKALWSCRGYLYKGFKKLYSGYLNTKALKNCRRYLNIKTLSNFVEDT